MQDYKPRLEQRLDSLREPFAAFIRAQATASGFLLLALIGAMLVANSPFAQQLVSLQDYELGLVFGQQEFTWSLLHLVNDGLIAVFFFLIGLEVKRELLAGELQDIRRVGLLLSAALGGMLAPAGLYLVVNSLGGGVVAGWGIPMATDTALAIGVLAALAARVPRSVVAFLVGVAIIDDIGAILVIALVYTDRLAWPALLAAIGSIAVLMLLNRSGIRHPLMYVAVGLLLWMAIVQSGVHASLAGVIVAATVPARPRIAPRQLKKRIHRAADELDADAHHEKVLGDAGTHDQIARVERVAQAATTPLRRWENSLELPVALLVLPLFAFLNAGIELSTQSLRQVLADPVAWGIVVGLTLGKPLGLWLGVRLGERAGLAARPRGLDDARLLGVGLVAGVGFTMSTFIAHLALEGTPETLESAKLAIVAASAISAVGGYILLRRAAARH